MISNFLSEISDLRNESTQRSAVRISGILENHKKFFESVLDPDFYNFIVKEFDELASYKGIQSNSKEFKEKYAKSYSALSYRLEKLL